MSNDGQQFNCQSSTFQTDASEGQEIVVYGRKLPIQELGEQLRSPNEDQQLSDVTSNVLIELTSMETPQDSSISEKSTVESLQVDAPLKKKFKKPQRVAKMGKPQQSFNNKDDFTQQKKRYKTGLCRHFMSTGYCSLESSCQFAHGHKELRKPSDPLPAVFGQQAIGAVHSNYKTTACKNWARTGHCKYKWTCRFYHDISERRKLTDPLPNFSTGSNMPPQNNDGFMSTDITQQDVIDFSTFISQTQLNAIDQFNWMGYDKQQQVVDGVDEFAVHGGFDPSKYLAAEPQPFNADQGMVSKSLPEKSDK